MTNIRTQLTNNEYNVISKLTSNLKIDGEFDVCTISSEEDGFYDYSERKYLSLKDGLQLLNEAIAYPLLHDLSKKDDAKVIVNLFKEFLNISKNEEDFLLLTDN